MVSEMVGLKHIEEKSHLFIIIFTVKLRQSVPIMCLFMSQLYAGYMLEFNNAKLLRILWN